jgi:hypothetical protein
MRIRLVIGIVLIAIGGVWIGQGVGAIRGSFMTGQLVWAVIGAVAAIIGIALLVGANRSRTKRDV